MISQKTSHAKLCDLIRDFVVLNRLADLLYLKYLVL